MHQDDLYEKLNSFSISSNEDKLTQAMNRAHISSPASSSAPFTFNLPSLPQQPQPQQQTSRPPQTQQPTIYSEDVQNKTDYIGNKTTSDWDPAAKSNWDSNSAANQHGDTQDGWGEGPPSYTSISQGTYFGFNSTIQPSGPVASLTPQLNANTQAFNRYKNTPVSFISAAKEAANDNNNQ
ncbi:hypothetical protein [Parasitella parasitica]|uniref:Uncharacterized protein n=1 Tax=Parasitella parasitica TaxID=35722 RepID=A0A0B7NKH3_9FUNG|nr:hypothetical protein [Parasitella parasitica]